MGSDQDNIRRTSEHYSKQWGSELDFKAFVKANPEAARVMPGRQLPWQDLFDRLRDEATRRPVRVYDAGCGFGDVLNAITAEPNPPALAYLGADIHGALDTLPRPANARLLQWDITQPLPEGGPFDAILCRAVIHHTPDPPATYRTLAAQLAPGGTLAITAYARKAPMREASDDALRALVVPMGNEEAFAAAHQFTRLGRELQAATGRITITEDLPLLGIEAGEYSVQGFLYKYFLKCWYNPAFPERHCDLVNFDWYHPPYAYRYTPEELAGWAEAAGLKVVRTASTEAQHYVEAVR